MIRFIRDMNDSPSATETWRAALAECPPISGGNSQRWCVAWGRCYTSLSSGIRPLGWLESENTDTDGVLWFDSLETAQAYLDDIASAGKDGGA